MRANKKIPFFVLVAMILCYAVGCVDAGMNETWYAITAEFAYMVQYEQNSARLLVVRIPLTLVERYRNHLLSEGTLSDVAGAVQHIFGESGDGFLRGGRVEWAAAGRDVFGIASLPLPDPQVVAVSLPVIAMDLQKNGMPTTLAALAGPGTDSEDLSRAVHTLALRDLQVQYYDLGNVFSESMDREMLTKWIREWTRLAIENAGQTTGE